MKIRHQPIEPSIMREAGDIHVVAYDGIHFLAAEARRQHCRDERASVVPATSVDTTELVDVYRSGKRGTVRDDKWDCCGCQFSRQ